MYWACSVLHRFNLFTGTAFLSEEVAPKSRPAVLSESSSDRNEVSNRTKSLAERKVGVAHSSSRNSSQWLHHRRVTHLSASRNYSWVKIRIFCPAARCLIERVIQRQSRIQIKRLFTVYSFLREWKPQTWLAASADDFASGVPNATTDRKLNRKRAVEGCSLTTCTVTVVVSTLISRTRDHRVGVRNEVPSVSDSVTFRLALAYTHADIDSERRYRRREVRPRHVTACDATLTFIFLSRRSRDVDW